MRGLLLTPLTVLALVASVSGCRCSPATPSPVTLRIVNGGADPLYVDATRGALGLTVQRDVGGTLFGFDDLACECRYCDNVCDPTCSCPPVGRGLIRRVGPGESAERTWDGVVQVAGLTSCGDGTCLSQVNAPLNEPFTLELCFSAQRPTGATFDDGGIGEGQLPRVSLTCVTKVFEPREGVVEIGPQRGAACVTNAQCLGADELCLDGSCTAGCPANDYPELGASWNLLIPAPENMGFFEQSARGTKKVFAGTGTLTSFLYGSEGLKVFLSRKDMATGETVTGNLTVTLPPGIGAPLEANTQVSVVVVEDPVANGARGLVLRDAVTSHLLLAADVGWGGAVLDAADVSPVVITAGSALLGCRQDGCGKLLYTAARFGSGGTSVELEPGEQGTLRLPEGEYRFLNVSSGSYRTTRCDFTEVRPWVFWRQSPP